MNKIKKQSETIENMIIEDCKDSGKTGKSTRKRSNKRKNKNIKSILGQTEGQDEQMFNEGDGLIDSDNENDNRAVRKDLKPTKTEPASKPE